MNKVLLPFAMVITGIAIALAIDPGRLAFTRVDAGGHQLRMLIRGRGGPAVVFETGGSGAAGGPLEAWGKVQPGVSKFTTTVTYDRAGIGLSAPGPKPRDARQIARELRTALRNARVAPPYILVGHSLGGPYVRVFAGMYPEDVRGMVLVDPTQEEFITWNQAHNPNHPEREDEEWKEIQASLAEARESRVPGGARVTLITAMGSPSYPPSTTDTQREEMKAMKLKWLQFQERWLEKLPSHSHLVTEQSGHGVPFEEPDLIVRAIREMVKDVANR